ncbi:Serine/threonine protein kinase [Ectocarpus siliculosus]|uniref:Serine/threonine protein kinase n=1 Tax=Ectocarpus siliculosus TaxID=2880 RepID=D8LST6_ECTSI|nr:Serine/threonine protein kinase [Ectocarpus siliculosus]|eukprot:CBN75286.1 Serine/threonine protein kinase [Ectocarpus siliculosus]
MEDPDIFGDISRMHQKQITIHAGDEGLAETGRVLYVEPDWTTDDLLQAAGRRLDLVSTPKRMFNCNGMEVADVMMIEDREVIFFTQGGDYVAPLLADGDDADGGGSTSGLPAVVGAYKVNEFLGKGGFGEVRVGEHQLTGERVALKFLRKSAIADMGAAERTTTEIQCLTALKHPNIIRLVQHINSSQNVIMVFELAEGGDLYQFLCGAPGQRVDEEEGRAVFRQIVSGVGYAHNQHICHRDMKLDNVLLSRPGCLKEVKLADFGLSDFYRPGATMRTNCGSISYLAPEVFRGTSNAGPPLDVWSIGVILFALLCGRLPFEGSDLQGTNRPREAAIRRRIMECRYKPVESLSPEAKDLLRRMLKLDPNERASIPEIFNHSWLRFRNVTSLDNQAIDWVTRGYGGVEQPAAVGPVIDEVGHPARSCSILWSPSHPGQEGQGDSSSGRAPGWTWRRRKAFRVMRKRWGGSGALRAPPSARRRRDIEEEVEEDEGHLVMVAETEGDANHSGSDSSGDESHNSRVGRGGRGRDFTLTMHPVRGSPNGGSAHPGGGGGGGVGGGGGDGGTTKPMIRMNSRLGATHPARCKTLSGLGGVSSTTINITSGGAAAVPGGGGGSITGGAGSGGSGGGGGGGIRSRTGVMKSRTMDLSHHLSRPAATAGEQRSQAPSRSVSPPPLQHHGQHEHRRRGTVRQRTWSASEAAAAAAQQQSDEDETWGQGAPEGDRRDHGEGRDQEGRDGDGGGGGGGGDGHPGEEKGTGILPSLSPRSAADTDPYRNDGSHGSGSRPARPRTGSSPRGDGSGRHRDNHHQREERKSPRESGSGSGSDNSPRYQPSMRPTTSPPSTAGGGNSRSRGGWSEGRGSWQGWGGSWDGKEGEDEDDRNRRDSGHLLPRSSCSPLLQEKQRDSAGGSGADRRDGEHENDVSYGHQGPSSPSRLRKSSSEGFKLPQSPSLRRQQLSRQGRSQGDVEHSDSSNSSSQPGATSAALSATIGGTERRSRGNEDERQDRNDERPDDANGAACSNAPSSGVFMLAPSIISSGTGRMGNTQRPRRSTLSTTGSDVSSDGENEGSDAQTPDAAARSEGTPTTASAAKTPLVPLTRGDCDQTKERGNEEEEEEDDLSSRDQESWGVGRDSKGEGTTPRDV